MKRSAEERVLQTIASLFGLGAVVFGALTAPAILAEAAYTPVWWTIGALAAVLGTAIALGVAGVARAARLVRPLAAAVAVGWGLAALTVPLVMPALETRDQSPWPLALTAVGTTAAALAWRPAVAWAGVGAMAALVLVDRIATATGDIVLTAVQDAAYAAFFAAVFVGLAVGAIRAGRAVDAAAERASAAVIEAAVERVRQDERARVDALVHDRVLATLLLTGRSLIGLGTAARQAGAALEGLRAMTEEARDSEPVDAASLGDRLRGEATRIVPFADVEVTIEADALQLDAPVAEAVLGATAEALRNAVQHAADAAVLIRLRADRGALEIVVIDDGPGFDPETVDGTRLGIRSSIVGRMQAVGGSADVRSRPGRGTAVRISVEAGP